MTCACGREAFGILPPAFYCFGDTAKQRIWVCLRCLLNLRKLRGNPRDALA